MLPQAAWGGGTIARLHEGFGGGFEAGGGRQVRFCGGGRRWDGSTGLPSRGRGFGPRSVLSLWPALPLPAPFRNSLPHKHGGRLTNQAAALPAFSAVGEAKPSFGFWVGGSTSGCFFQMKWMSWSYALLQTRVLWLGLGLSVSQDFSRNLTFSIEKKLWGFFLSQFLPLCSHW